MTINVAANGQELAKTAAELFEARAVEHVNARGRFSVALSGGTTPRLMYGLLAQAPLRDRVPWANAHFFWGDERCVPANDPRSNYGEARQLLLDHVPVPAPNIHPMPGELDPQQAAPKYEQELRTYFSPGPPRFDLILLGLGEDGHTASLFPGRPGLGSQSWIISGHKEGETISRLSMTPTLINQAREVVVLVSGASKANVLHDVLEGPRNFGRLPAQSISPAGELLWLVDKPAAANLKV